MNTTTIPADTAEPLSSQRDDPDPSQAASERDSADPEPPEPASDVNAPPDDDSAISIDASEDVAHDIDFLWLDDHLRSVFNHLSAPVERVSIRIVCDSEMTDLNRRFHDADETTDVLTFSNTPADGPIDADLALCADEAVRQSFARGHSIERELLLYALHGLLHCCGFGDGDDESFAAMHAEEDRILKAIGVGATFGDHWGVGA